MGRRDACVDGGDELEMRGWWLKVVESSLRAMLSIRLWERIEILPSIRCSDKSGIPFGSYTSFHSFTYSSTLLLLRGRYLIEIVRIHPAVDLDILIFLLRPGWLL